MEASVADMGGLMLRGPLVFPGYPLQKLPRLIGKGFKAPGLGVFGVASDSSWYCN